MADHHLDLRGLKCPLPALLTRKRLAALRAGDALEIECTDQLSAIDIPNLIGETGDRLETQEQRGEIFMFRIRKRAG